MCHVSEREGPKVSLKVLAEPVGGVSYSSPREEICERRRLGGVRKEGQKFSFKLKFVIFVRNTRGKLSRVLDMRV